MCQQMLTELQIPNLTKIYSSVLGMSIWKINVVTLTNFPIFHCVHKMPDKAVSVNTNSSLPFTN
jgi:hypothetical protein